MGVVLVKEGVEFTRIAPGGFRILAAIDRTAAAYPFDLTITSACDGEHSGPEDPHHKGEAYDVRSHDIASDVKPQVLAAVMVILGWQRFYGFLEDAGGPDEHFHFQVKKGTTYP